MTAWDYVKKMSLFFMCVCVCFSFYGVFKFLFSRELELFLSFHDTDCRSI